MKKLYMIFKDVKIAMQQEDLCIILKESHTTNLGNQFKQF